MRMYDVIKSKRDGNELTDEEIKFFVNGYASGEIPDYQASALLMAIYFKGMTARETATLTFAIRDSGDTVDLSGIKGIVVDKHSTGGVGDKTTLVLAPIVAACGVKMAKMSGRGLGHTGGTIDKLESIKGFRTELTQREFFDAVNNVGVSVIGQSGNLAPADKKLYALRDVTATVDSLPLIVSSIMGKKLASGSDCILLDVKEGSGAFMKTLADARALGEAMVKIGDAANKKVTAVVTDMDLPLGNAIGNSIEVIEAIDTLNGKGPKDFTELCLTLSAYLLKMAGLGDYNHCYGLAKQALDNKNALKVLADMVKAQGGDESYVYDTDKFAKAKVSHDVTAARDGYIVHTDAAAYGEASLVLGAGRAKKGDPIDFAAGIYLYKKTGDKIAKGDKIATLYTDKPSSIAEAEKILLEATTIGNDKCAVPPLILDVIGG